jgi:hypothetical protein
MPPVRRAAQILGQRVLLGAQRLVHLVAAIGDGNSFKDFPGKKASLRRCQTRGDDDSVNAQPTRCAESAGASASIKISLSMVFPSVTGFILAVPKSPPMRSLRALEVNYDTAFVTMLLHQCAGY